MTITVRADKEGMIVQLLVGEEASYYSPDPAVMWELTLDAASNADLAKSLSSDPGSYRLINGVLQRDDLSVAIAPDSDAMEFAREVDALLKHYDAAGTFDQAQSDRILAQFLRREKQRLS